VEGSLGRQENQASEETAGRSVRLNPESMAMMHWLFQVGGEAANKVDWWPVAARTLVPLPPVAARQSAADTEP